MKVEEESNISQAIESNSSNCNFRDAVIAAVIGLFHGIRFFYPTNHESPAAFRLPGQPFVNSVYMCGTNKKSRTVYIFKKSIKKQYRFFEKVWLILFFSHHSDIKANHLEHI